LNPLIIRWEPNQELRSGQFPAAQTSSATPDSNLHTYLSPALQDKDVATLSSSLLPNMSQLATHP